MYKELIKKIIEEQSQIMGPTLARSRAISTGSISYAENNEINITSEPATAVDRLVKSYGELFGQASVDVCIDVIKQFPYDQVSTCLPEYITKVLHK